MQIQELYMSNVDHHEFRILKGSMPIKLIMNNNVMILLVRCPDYVGTNSEYKSIRISRFRSFSTAPDNAFYIDSLVDQNGILHHYFEMDVM